MGLERGEHGILQEVDGYRLKLSFPDGRLSWFRADELERSPSKTQALAPLEDTIKMWRCNMDLAFGDLLYAMKALAEARQDEAVLERARRAIQRCEALIDERP